MNDILNKQRKLLSYQAKQNKNVNMVQEKLNNLEKKVEKKFKDIEKKFDIIGKIANNYFQPDENLGGLEKEKVNNPLQSKENLVCIVNDIEPILNFNGLTLKKNNTFGCLTIFFVSKFLELKILIFHLKYSVERRVVADLQELFLKCCIRTCLMKFMKKSSIKQIWTPYTNI